MTSSQQEINTFAKSFVATMNPDPITEFIHKEASLSEHREIYKDLNLYYTNNIDCIKMNGIIVLRLAKIDYSYEDMFTFTLYDEYGSIKGCCSLDIIEQMEWRINDIIILKNCSIWENEYLNITKNNVTILNK